MDDMSAGIVDTNFLKEPDLRRVLSAGAHVVITRHVLLEALRAKTASQAREELRVLATFPKQVLFAKPLGNVLSTRIFYQRQLIDEEVTEKSQIIFSKLLQTSTEHPTEHGRRSPTVPCREGAKNLASLRTPTWTLFLPLTA
jgi:hypothetical protein